MGGHEIVATIAYGRLTPRTKKIVTQLLSVPIAPVGTTAASKGNFVRAAVWADEVRDAAGFERTGAWHYIDNPLGITPQTPIPPHMVGAENIETALRHEIAVLRDPRSSQHDRAESLRFLIHFVGDIHQPLHCAARVSPLNPDGDHGGNSYSLSGQFHNLHGYWDDGLGSFPASAAGVPEAAKRIAHDFPASDSGWKAGGPTNIDGWMKESVSLARSFVYTGVQRGKVPPETYRREGIKIAGKRVAWAGYRLAALLNSLF